jgi:hypothetical protein
VGAELLAVDLDDLRSRQRGKGLARARDLLIMLGVERFRLSVKDLAHEMRKSSDGMSQAIARASRRRRKDKQFLAELNRLDRLIAATTQHDQTTAE